MQRREPRREVRVAAVDGERVLHEIVRADAEERDVVDERVARTAAAGVSIITPSGTSRRNSHAARLRASRAASSSSSRARRTSSSVTTSGSMMRTSPCTAARSSARSCTPNSSGWSRHMRIARQPRNGFASVGNPPTGSLSPPMSNVRMTTGRPPNAFDDARVRPVLLLLVGHRRAADDEELRAHEANAFGAAVRRELRFLGKIDVRAQRDAHAVGRHRLERREMAAAPPRRRSS